MKLGEKLRYLRLVEGTLRGMDREMTQQDLTRLLKKETGKGLSQSYLSQIESGARPHLTNASRMLLARFFKVHPGYLVDDPEGYHTELTSDLRATEDRMDLWLINGAEQAANDPELQHALLEIAKHAASHAPAPRVDGHWPRRPAVPPQITSRRRLVRPSRHHAR